MSRESSFQILVLYTAPEYLVTRNSFASCEDMTFQIVGSNAACGVGGLEKEETTRKWDEEEIKLHLWLLYSFV